MLEINLLPPQQRKAREVKESKIKIIFAFLFMFIILIISWSLLFSLQKIMQINLNAQKQELTSFEKYFNQEQNKEIEQEVENINKILSRVSIIEKNKSNFSETLVELAKLASSDFYFSNVKINKQDEKIEIMGFAKTRETLLKFQDNLEKSEYFENVTSPVSNIISPENINFKLEAKLTKKSITNQK